MRLTVEQNVLFKWVKKESLQAFYDRIAAADLGAADANTLGDVVELPGAESCRLAVTQSRGLGRGLTEYTVAPDIRLILVRWCRGKGHLSRSADAQNGLRQHHYLLRSGSRAACGEVGGKAIHAYSTLCSWAGAVRMTARPNSAKWNGEGSR
jgi:hypothetical protein